MAAGDAQRAAALLEQSVDYEPDVDTLLRLASVRRVLGNFDAAIEAASLALRRQPDHFLALLMLATLREATHAEHRAVRTYRAALQSAPESARLPRPVANQLDWARERVAAEDRWLRGVREWTPDSALGESQAARLEVLRENILANGMAPHDAPTQFLIPELRSKEFFAPGEFRGAAELEQSTAQLREEFLGLTRAKAPQLAPFLSGLSFAQPDPDVVGKWGMVPLVRGGEVIEEYAAICPTAMRLFEALDAPDIPRISPSLYFSVLEPHSRIEPHMGIINARLIVHVPLIVPDGCGLRVGGHTAGWEPGRALVFDDMIDHEAWNDSDRIRVVLIADVWRPDLGPIERREITRLMGRNFTIG